MFSIWRLFFTFYLSLFSWKPLTRVFFLSDMMTHLFGGENLGNRHTYLDIPSKKLIYRSITLVFYLVPREECIEMPNEIEFSWKKYNIFLQQIKHIKLYLIRFHLLPGRLLTMQYCSAFVCYCLYSVMLLLKKLGKLKKI